LRLALLRELSRPQDVVFEDGHVDLGIEHFQGAAAGVDLVIVRQIGEPFEDAEQLLVPGASPDLYVAGAALRTERPEPRQLSPLSGTAAAVKPLSARTRWSAWLLPACPGSWPNPMRTRLPSCAAVSSSNLWTSPGFARPRTISKS
jgi:hypothetical protein